MRSHPQPHTRRLARGEPVAAPMKACARRPVKMGEAPLQIATMADGSFCDAKANSMKGNAMPKKPIRA